MAPKRTRDGWTVSEANKSRIPPEIHMDLIISRKLFIIRKKWPGIMFRLLENALDCLSIVALLWDCDATAGSTVQ